MEEWRNRQLRHHLRVEEYLDDFRRLHLNVMQDVLMSLNTEAIEDLQRVAESQNKTPEEIRELLRVSSKRYRGEKDVLLSQIRQSSSRHHLRVMDTMSQIFNEEARELKETLYKHLEREEELQKKKKEREAKRVVGKKYRKQLFETGRLGTNITAEKAKVEKKSWVEKALLAVICDEVSPRIQEKAEQQCYGCELGLPSQKDHQCLMDSWDDKVEFHLYDAICSTPSDTIINKWVSILQQMPSGISSTQASHLKEDVLSLETMMNLNPELYESVQYLLHTDDSFAEPLVAEQDPLTAEVMAAQLEEDQQDMQLDQEPLQLQDLVADQDQGPLQLQDLAADQEPVASVQEFIFV